LENYSIEKSIAQNFLFLVKSLFVVKKFFKKVRKRLEK